MKAATLLAGVLALVCSAPAVEANDYPNKPITLIIGFAPGGSSDVMARILTKRMEELLRQPVIIENRAGAGGGIAANLVARAPADGYTILLATGSSLAINVSLYKNLGYDPEKDFVPVAQVVAIPFGIAALAIAGIGIGGGVERRRRRQMLGTGQHAACAFRALAHAAFVAQIRIRKLRDSGAHYEIGLGLDLVLDREPPPDRARRQAVHDDRPPVGGGTGLRPSPQIGAGIG